MERLNLGCGLDHRPDWTNLDRDLDRLADEQFSQVVHDLRDGPMPFRANWFAVVVANHFLHMFDGDELPDVLNDVHRVLAPGGQFRVLEADPVRAFRAWEQGNGAWFPISDEVEPTIDGKLARYLTWHGTRRSLLPEGYLVRLLEDAGFVDCTLSPFGLCELDSREGESIIVQASKP